MLRAGDQCAILTARMLDQLEISKQLRHEYCKNGWLDKLGRGVYVLPNKDITYAHVVMALQEQLELDVHLGGKTVFSLRKRTHYVKQDSFYLFVNSQVRLPQWVQKISDLKNLQLIFAGKSPILNTSVGFAQFEGLRVSSLERAMFEQLHLLGKYETFDECYKLFETLTDARSQVVQELLENCSSIKVKRLFLYMAEELNCSWLKKLNLNHIDLGRGVRQIVPNGRYISKYQITVPEYHD